MGTEAEEAVTEVEVVELLVVLRCRGASMDR